jgi:hypothetical protein
MPGAAVKQPRKRPWYLVAALLGALALGLSGAYSGCEGWAIYRGQIAQSDVVAGFASDADRDAVGGAWDKLVAAYDAAEPREYPLTVGLLLVSATMVLFAMRGMAGRGSARNVLVQLVLVQAAITVAEFILTKDIIAADGHYRTVRQLAQTHDPELERVLPSVLQAWRWFVGFIVGGRAVVAMLVAYALTRPGSREFFEATSDPAVEQ